VDHGLAVQFRDTGLHRAEPAVTDDHLGVRGAEPGQAGKLVELVRDRPQPAP
jgi:hypothetical protein